MNFSFPQFPRIIRSAGSPYETGVQTGCQLGPDFAVYIDQYLSTGPYLRPHFNRQRHQEISMAIFASYPDRFRQELEGLAQGAGIPLKKVTEWVTAETCMSAACSGFLLHDGEKTWIGRNNDLWSPHLWGFARHRAVSHRIPVTTFGLAGDAFSATGYNQAGIWLHYNYLKAPDQNDDSLLAQPCYLQLVDMLESCESYEDVFSFLQSYPRPDGMMLFMSDSGRQKQGIFECTCHDMVYRPLPRERGRCFLVGTNHYTQAPYENSTHPDRADSLSRYRRLDTLLRDFSTGKQTASFNTLRAVLADEGIEKRQSDYGTVYANLYCPETGETWYTFGGYPAASCGRWREVVMER